MVHLIDAPEDPFIKNRYSMLKKQVQQDYLGLSTLNTILIKENWDDFKLNK